MTLTSNSSITIDGTTINGHASVIMIWEKAVANAIRSGAVAWVRINDDHGTAAVLVHPGTTVHSYISRDDLPVSEKEDAERRATNSNLAAWVDVHIDPSDDIWPLVKSVGIDAEIAANKAAE